MAKKAKKVTQQNKNNLLAVAWIPDEPLTQTEVLKMGGRIIDTDLSKLDAKEVVRCLNFGTKGLAGKYIIVN